MYSNINGSVATAMLSSALAYCQEKVGRKEAFGLLKRNECNAIEYFRFGLAKQVGTCLGENSEFVKYVYLYPDTPDEDPILTLPLTLIVYVEKHTAALDSIVDLLQNTLLEEYRVMFAPTTDCLNVFLNIYLIDTTELAKRKGMAASIGALFKPAFRAWSRIET